MSLRLGGLVMVTVMAVLLLPLTLKRRPLSHSKRNVKVPRIELFTSLTGMTIGNLLVPSKLRITLVVGSCFSRVFEV